MKKIHLFLLIGLITVVSLKAQNLSEKKANMIQAEVEAAFQEGLRAGESLDAEKVAGSVDDRLHAGHIVNGVYFSSVDPIMQNVADNMQGLNKLQYVIKDKKITVLSKNAAIVAVSGNTNGESVSGQQFSAPFAWTFIYRKTGDQWKVIHTHQSNPR